MIVGLLAICVLSTSLVVYKCIQCYKRASGTRDSVGLEQSSPDNNPGSKKAASPFRVKGSHKKLQNENSQRNGLQLDFDLEAPENGVSLDLGRDSHMGNQQETAEDLENLEGMMNS